MKLAKLHQEYGIITDTTIGRYKDQGKIHILKLSLSYPSAELVLRIMNNYPHTNRFIVSDYIKNYNVIFRNTDKKYYVENTTNDGILTFFKRNNKVILNFNNLRENIRYLALNVMLEDILNNVEAVVISEADFKSKESIFFQWPGNVLIG